MFLNIYYFFCFILFSIGLIGILIIRRHIIIILVSFEIMLLAINLQFILVSINTNDFMGQLFALLILAVAAAETAIGLALTIAFYRLRGGLYVGLITFLKG
jgi:NADH-quinone oxidoreductase subunit K